MVYTPVHDNWEDDPSTATPILGADLEHMEAGIVEGTRDASESQTGNVRLSTDSEMTTGTSLTRVPSVKRVVDYVTAALSSIPSAVAASETVAGIVERATTAEMTTGTDDTRVPSVKKVADYVTSKLAGAASETVAGLLERATAAEMTTGTDDTRVPSVKKVADYVAALLLGKADKSGSFTQFADVADAAYTDGDTPVFSAGALQPTDLSDNFAGLDGALRLDSANFPQYYVPTIIILEGDVPPGTFPSYGLVGKLPAAASLIPTLLDVDSVRAANNVVLQLPEAMVAGEYIGFSLGWDNSTPFDHMSAAFGGTGPGAGTFDFGTYSIPNTTAGTVNGFVKLTADAAAGSTITFTARDASNAAINRVHFVAAIYRLPNLVSSSPRDQQAVGGGGSSSVLTSIGATISTDTVQQDELAIGSAVNSAGTAPNTRDIAGTNDWQTLANHLSDNGASARRLYVGYKVLSTIGQPSLTTQVTLSGTATQTGAWAAKLVTYKGL